MAFCYKVAMAMHGVFRLVSSALVLVLFFFKSISHILSSHTVIPGNHSGVKEFLSVKKERWETSCCPGTWASRRGFQPSPARSCSDVAAARDQGTESQGQAPTRPGLRQPCSPGPSLGLREERETQPSLNHA